MKDFKNTLLYRGFHCHENGDKFITIDDMKVKGSWIVGYLHLTNGLAFITPYNLKVTFLPENATLLSPAVAVIKDTVSMATGVYDDFDLPQLIFQNDIVRYDDGNVSFEGRVVFELGSFGIATDDNIPIKSISDNFVSFCEMIVNQEYVDDYHSVEYVTVIGKIWREENA